MMAPNRRYELSTEFRTPSALCGMALVIQVPQGEPPSDDL